MRIPIGREKKIKMLKALKDGYINTLDFPELYGKQFNYFQDIMIEATSMDDEDGNLPEEQAGDECSYCNHKKGV